MPDMAHPISIKSKVRFAVVGPGLPAPLLILYSGEDVDDLVGYYSVREAGLSKIVDEDVFHNVGSLIGLVMGVQAGDYAPTYQAIDVWYSDSKSKREGLFSLIFDGETIGRSERVLLKKYQQALEPSISRLIDAYKIGNIEEVQYIGQMISTFVSLLSTRSEQEKTRARRRQQVLIYIGTIYAGIIAFVTASYVLYDWIHRRPL